MATKVGLTTFSDVLDMPPQINQTPDGVRVVRNVQLISLRLVGAPETPLLPWMHLKQAYVDFLGMAKIKRSVDALGTFRNYVVRTLPHCWQPFGDRRTVWCQNVLRTEFIRHDDQPIARDFQADPTMPTYRWARLTLEYRSLPFRIREDTDPLVLNQGQLGGNSRLGGLPDESYLQRYVSRKIRGSGSLTTLPRGKVYAYPSPPDVWPKFVIPQEMPYPVSTFAMAYTWHQVPVAAIPFAVLQKAVNHVNHDPFDLALIPGVGWPVGTVLFKDFNYDEYQNIFGDPIADVTYNFLVRLAVTRFGTILGWNSTLGYIPDTGLVDFMKTADVTGVAVFPDAIFNDLFLPPQTL